MTTRIAQWGLGNIGKLAIRAVAEDPALELVACFNRAGDKTGKDAGKIAGLEPVGVTVVSTTEEIVAARPDLVLYMPLKWDVDAMVQLLEAGIDVISTANFITGLSYGKEEQARLNEAALHGGASLYGTGINPGFADILALMATQVCRKVTNVKLLESADATHYNSPETWHSLGFGGPKDAPGALDKVRQRAGVFADAVEMIARGLKVELDEIVFEGQLGTATEDLDLGYMTIAKGMACGMHLNYVGMKDGKRLIEVATMTRLGYAMEPDWPVQHGYQIDVTGDPSVQCRFLLDHEADPAGVVATAMPAINAIPHVISAKAGLVTAADLPLIAAAGRIG